MLSFTLNKVARLWIFGRGGASSERGSRWLQSLVVEKQHEAREGRIPLYAAAVCSRILGFSPQECSLHTLRIATFTFEVKIKKKR